MCPIKYDWLPLLENRLMLEEGSYTSDFQAPVSQKLSINSKLSLIITCNKALLFHVGTETSGAHTS